MGDQVRSVRVRMTAEVAGYLASMKTAGAATKSTAKEMDGLSSSSKKVDSDLDKVSGRVRLIAQAAAVIGPAFVPISAVAIPALAGLTLGLASAVTGAGTAVIAFQGLKTAWTALEKARMEPTVQNLEAARIQMEGLSPASRALLHDAQGLIPVFRDLRDTAAEGLFPGVREGAAALGSDLPLFKQILAGVSHELGSIAKDTGESLASDRWTPFLEFIGQEAPRDLGLMADATGNLGHALAELLMGTDDLSHGFLNWLVDSTAALDRWAASVDQTEGYRELISYIRENGPQVGETLAAIANAALKIAEAAAPLGGPVLAAIEGIAKVLGGIAGSDIGAPIVTAIAALVLFNKTIALSQKGAAKLNGGFVSLSSGAKFGGLLLGIDAVSSSLDKLFDKQLDGSNLDRSLEALAHGRVVGELKDKFGGDLDGLVKQLRQATQGGAVAVPRGLERIPVIGGLIGNVTEALPGGVSYTHATDNVKALDKALADMVDNGNAEDAKAIVQEIVKAGASSSQISKGFEQYGIALKNATGESVDFSIAQQKQSEATAAARGAARDTAHQFLAFSSSLSDAKVSLSDWLKELEQQDSALEHFGKNAKKAADNGLRHGLIEALRQAGPQGALRMKQLANGTDTEIARANAAWLRGRKAIKEYVRLTVPKKVIDVNATPAQRKLNALIALILRINGLKLKAPKPPKTPKVPVYDPGGTDGDPDTPMADGGYTGRGGKWQAAGVVHKGEFVFSSEATRGHEVMLSNLHKTLRGYSGGGYVDNTPDSVLGDLYGPGSNNNPGKGNPSHKPPEHHASSAALKRFRKALEEATKSLDKERQKRDALRSERDQVRSTVADSLKSDLFSTDRSANYQWMSAGARKKELVGGVFSTLAADNSKIEAFTAAEKRLKLKGLDGRAYAELASSGDLDRVQAFANLSKAELAKYEKDFELRAKGAKAAGFIAGDAGFGKEIAASTAHIVDLVDEVHDLRKDIKKASAHGKASRSATASSVRTRKGR